MRRRRTIGASSRLLRHVALALLLVAGGERRDARSELLEGIAAQVGSELVFLSEVEERAYLIRLRRAGAQAPPTEHDRRQALDELINEKILQIYASANQIEVGEAELDDAVERALADVRSGFDSDAEFDRALAGEGLTLQSLRENYEEEIRDKMVRDRVIAAEIYDRVEVSRREVQAYYEAHLDELQKSERRFTLSRLSHPLPLTEPQAFEARQLLGRLRAEIKTPEAFKEAAIVHSQDPATAARGGDLGWIAQGQLVDEIDATVSALEVGQMSDIAQSRFGLHLFFVDGRREEESRVFHILRTTTVDQQRADEIRRDLSAAREPLVAGEIDWRALVLRFPGAVQDWESRQLGEEEIPSELRATLSGMRAHQLTPIMSTSTTLSLVRIEAIRGGRVRPLGELYAGIEERLRLEKLDERFAEWIAERRERVYVKEHRGADPAR